MSVDRLASILEGDSGLPRPGEVVAGKYLIERVLGAGGMGVVMAARHLSLDERVAIKFLLPGTWTEGEVVARFAREARAAIRIKNEHVVRILDVDTLASGAPFMVMEYLDGIDLEKWLEAHERLHPEEAVEFVLQACEAIAEAHVAGIVHRDLKPSNMYVVRRGDGLLAVKVFDFGISKMTESAELTGGEPGMMRVMGSPQYMSPEQLASTHDVDGRTDIWALGIILYQLLTGRPPFQAESLPQLCTAIISGPILPPRSLQPDLPPGLDAVVLRALERDRRARFADVGELAMALAEFGPARARSSAERVWRTIDPRARAGAPAPPALLAGANVPNVHSSAPTVSAVLAPVRSASTWSKRSIAAIALALAVGAAVLVLGRTRNSRDADVQSGAATSVALPSAALPSVGLPSVGLPSAASSSVPSELSPPLESAALPPEEPAAAASIEPAASDSSRAMSRRAPASSRPSSSASRAPAKRPARPLPLKLIDERR